MKGVFEHVYNSALENYCIKVTKGLILNISLREDRQESSLIITS